MSKEWKCADCVKYKTDACSTCACGYTPTVSCRDVLVDFDYAYQQGRAEKYQEITSEYMLLTEKQVADIRADAIDECIRKINELTCGCTQEVFATTICNVLEGMKEN